MSFKIEPPIDPHLRRWMLFVDGENLTLRAQELARKKSIALQPGGHYEPNVFVWMPGVPPTQNVVPGARVSVQMHAVRAYYYTSLVGDQQRLDAVTEALWSLGFSPEVFKKTRQETKAKGVDIALARDMLGHGYRDNFDVALLVAGDGDYVPLVTELKHLGKLVYVGFFGASGLSAELRLASDSFFELEPFFFDQWQRSASGTSGNP
jgi:hypothetical protein